MHILLVLTRESAIDEGTLSLLPLPLDAMVYYSLEVIRLLYVYSEEEFSLSMVVVIRLYYAALRHHELHSQSLSKRLRQWHLPEAKYEPDAHDDLHQPPEHPLPRADGYLVSLSLHENPLWTSPAPVSRRGTPSSTSATVSPAPAARSSSRLAVVFTSRYIVLCQRFPYFNMSRVYSPAWRLQCCCDTAVSPPYSAAISPH